VEKPSACSKKGFRKVVVFSAQLASVVAVRMLCFFFCHSNRNDETVAALQVNFCDNIDAPDLICELKKNAHENVEHVRQFDAGPYFDEKR
jgi:hypothetical protein